LPPNITLDAGEAGEADGLFIYAEAE